MRDKAQPCEKSEIQQMRDEAQPCEQSHQEICDINSIYQAPLSHTSNFSRILCLIYFAVKNTPLQKCKFENSQIHMK